MLLEKQLRNMNKMKKKAQEEIVGFVLIVVLVAIIFLVFLSITIRQENNVKRGGAELEQFLSSLMNYDSSCAVSYESNYLSFEEMIKKCYDDSMTNCLSGERVCEVLKKEGELIFGESWQVSDVGKIKGYEFKAMHLLNSSRTEAGKQEIVKFGKGNCQGSYGGAEHVSYADEGIILSEFKLCY